MYLHLNRLVNVIRANGEGGAVEIVVVVAVNCAVNSHDDPSGTGGTGRPDTNRWCKKASKAQIVVHMFLCTWSPHVNGANNKVVI